MLSVAGRGRVMDGRTFLLDGHVQWPSETLDPRSQVGQWLPWTTGVHKIESPNFGSEALQKGSEKKVGSKRQRPENSTFPYSPSYCTFIPSYPSIPSPSTVPKNDADDSESSISNQKASNTNVQLEKIYHGEFNLQPCDGDGKAPEGGPSSSQSVSQAPGAHRSVSSVPPAPRFKPVENSIRPSADIEGAPPQSPDQWQRSTFSSMTCESPVQRILTPLGSGSGGRSTLWTPLGKSSSGADDGPRPTDGDDPFGLCRYTPTHSLFMGLDGTDYGFGGNSAAGGGYWTPTPPMGQDMALGRQGRFAGSPASAGGGHAEAGGAAPPKLGGQLFPAAGGAPSRAGAANGTRRSGLPHGEAKGGPKGGSRDYSGFELEQSSSKQGEAAAAGGSHHQQMLGVWRSLADVPSRLVNTRAGEEQPNAGLRPPAAPMDGVAASSGGRGKPRGGASLRPHLGKARQRQQLPVGLQPGRQSAHGGRGSRPEEGAPAGSSEGTGEDEAGGRGGGGGGGDSKGRGERRAAKYKGVTWDRVKKMWRVRLCLVGGSRQHVGYFADEDEGASAYLTALQSAKAQGLHVRCEG